jgi:hypothetical protein
MTRSLFSINTRDEAMMNRMKHLRVDRDVATYELKYQKFASECHTGEYRVGCKSGIYFVRRADQPIVIKWADDLDTIRADGEIHMFHTVRPDDVDEVHRRYQKYGGQGPTDIASISRCCFDVTGSPGMIKI